MYANPAVYGDRAKIDGPPVATKINADTKSDQDRTGNDPQQQRIGIDQRRDLIGDDH